jgi:hypothetical protein
MKNALEIFNELEKTNCGKCGLPTCLAFAAAVFKGDRRIEECPYVDASLAQRVSSQKVQPIRLEEEQAKAMAVLQEEVARMDLLSSAQRLGARQVGDHLAIEMLGRDFRVDQAGNITSDCHIHGWVTIPLLNYCLHCKGTPLSHKWVPFRELPNGPSWNPLYLQRCERPLKKIADTHTDLFEDMITIFKGKPVQDRFDSDISLVLWPLPTLPTLICYWKPEDDLESAISIFYDSVSEDNLNMEALYILIGGLVSMFEKIRDTHGE